LVWTGLVSWDFPGTTCMGSVMLHTKFEVSRFNSLAVRQILRCVTRFGLVGLVWTGLVSCDFLGLPMAWPHVSWHFLGLNDDFLGLPWDFPKMAAAAPPPPPTSSSCDFVTYRVAFRPLKSRQQLQQGQGYWPAAIVLWQEQGTKKDRLFKVRILGWELGTNVWYYRLPKICIMLRKVQISVDN
jgi:hypothetical protein